MKSQRVTMRDQVKQPLYEHMGIDRGGTFDFFQRPIGQPKEDVEMSTFYNLHNRTNMYMSGCLPRGNAFMIEGIRVVFYSGGATDAERLEDARKIYGGGGLRLDVGNRIYLNLGPLGLFPPIVSLYQSIRDNDRALNSRGYFSMKPKLYLESCQYFRLRISIDSRIRLSAPSQLGVILDGLLERDCL